MAKARLKAVLMTERASRDITYWSVSGIKKKVARMNALRESCWLDAFSGIGVPEQLRFKDEATYSRRIDKSHRLVYRIEDQNLVIISARFHYEK